MSSMPKCYSLGCSLVPVFKCSCEDISFTCQKHCFVHMQGLCGGKLEPFIVVDGPKSVHKPPPVPQKHSEISKRLEPVPMCELITTLFPGESAVYQCSMCGKLVPKSQIPDHICERNEICVLNISFQRQCYNKYSCSVCNLSVHSAFLYPHADLHNSPNMGGVSPEEITKITSTIIQNDGKPSARSVESNNKLEKDSKQSKATPVSKIISNSLKPAGKKNLACLTSPLDSKSLPVKRGRVIELESDE